MYREVFGEDMPGVMPTGATPVATAHAARDLPLQVCGVDGYLVVVRDTYGREHFVCVTDATTVAEFREMTCPVAPDQCRLFSGGRQLSESGEALLSSTMELVRGRLSRVWLILRLAGC